MTVWKNKKVLITGHTGFKGAWLSLYLSELGAMVYGVALDPPTNPNFFSLTKISSLLASDIRLDLREQNGIANLLAAIQPEMIFHLAAQSLVHDSYDFPVETYATNVMGTAHLLEAVRHCDSVRAVLVVTTDKCYENNETMTAYVESDRLGGHDPYSSSKACTELLVSAYRSSYFNGHRKLPIATARAGNVIGGGDWAKDRLIPDCIRALSQQQSMLLRSPHAVRPWQHVLESISGYVLLAEHLLNAKGMCYADSWNFGPEIEDIKSVNEVIQPICQTLNIPIHRQQQMTDKQEASLLCIDSTKAKTRLGWKPRFTINQAIEETMNWYQHWMKKGDMLTYSREQIKRYFSTVKQKENAELL